MRHQSNRAMCIDRNISGQVISGIRVILSIALGMLGQALYQNPSMAKPREDWPNEFRKDADLHGVFFIDAQMGWAVGDRGAIWQTTDGGQRWQLQPSPVGCRLNAVFFLDRRRGWIVGGWTHPYTHRSRGIVLRTANGGQRWTLVKRLEIPELRGVRFTDVLTGQAAGFGNSLYPSGYFVTGDGGRSWQTISSDTAQDWSGVALMDSGQALLVSSGGAVASVRNHQLKSLRDESPRFRQIRNVSARQDGPAVLVGDGGLVILTDDGGRRWSNLTGNLPGSVSQQFDFQAVATYDAQIWVAGIPGTIVLKSGNGGRSWETHETGQTLPLEDIWFIDRNVGWAVGAQGMILKTTDGGAQWTIQHSVSERVALLGIFASLDEIPPGLFGQTSAVLNHRSRCIVVGTGEADHATPHVSTSVRAHEALVLMGSSGVSTLWGFRLPAKGLRLSKERIATTWKRDHNRLRLSPAGTEQLRQRIASAIRQWQPSVVVTTPTDTGRLGGLAETVGTSIEDAADPAVFPELGSVARLRAWQVPVAVAVAPNEAVGTALRIEADEIALSLAKPLKDLISQASSLVANSPVAPVLSYSAIPIVGDLRPKSVREMFQTAGIRLTGDQRRKVANRENVDIEGMRRALQRTENVHAILARAVKSNASADAWLGQVDDLIGDFGYASGNGISGGDVLLRLIHNCSGKGKMDAAIQLAEMFAKRFPEHPALELTVLDLIADCHSAERRHHRPTTDVRLTNQVRVTVNPATTNTLAKKLFLGSNLAAGAAAGGRHDAVLQRNGTGDVTIATPIQRLWKLVDQLGPRVAAESRLQMAAAVNRPEPVKHTSYRTALKRMAISLPDVHWRACAQGELWLAGDEQQIYKPILHCDQSPAPHLDGVHDETTWATVETVRLVPADDFGVEMNATVAAAHDNNFLYFAIECDKVDTVEYPDAERPRPRDPNLSEQDRVDLYLDVDRDYATAWRLTIDSRGWARESLGNDVSWDPTWYVASHDDPEKWSVEAALPLDKLGGGRPRSKTAWAIGIQRVVPGAGRQAWPPDVISGTRGERFGYLFFK